MPEHLRCVQGRSALLSCVPSVLEVTTPGLQHRAGNDDCTLSELLGDTNSFILLLFYECFLPFVQPSQCSAAVQSFSLTNLCQKNQLTELYKPIKA